MWVDIEYENLGINIASSNTDWDVDGTDGQEAGDRYGQLGPESNEVGDCLRSSGFIACQKCEEDVGKGLTEASKMYLRTERRRRDRRTMGIW